MKRKSLVLMALADPFQAGIGDSNGKSDEEYDVHEAVAGALKNIDPTVRRF